MNPSHIDNSKPARRRPRAGLALVLAGLLGATALTTAIDPVRFDANAATLNGNVIEAAAPTTGFADLVEEIEPAVVAVQVTPRSYDLSSSDSNGSARKGGGNLDRQDEGVPGFQFREPGFERSAQGSGFFISADGYLVTNYHVVETQGKIEVTLNDGAVFEARLIGQDSKTDLALLKIDADREFEFVTFAESEARVGDWIIAIGNPFGLGNSVTTGIVSASGRDIGAGPYDDYLQIDAPINRGNSGGPAFNLDGEVIGVNTAIYSPSGGNVGIGFAIPARIVSDIVEDLRDDGTVTRGWLGVHIQNVTAEIAETLDVDGAKGALVAQVAGGSPAEQSGLRVGDLIVQVNQETIEDPKGLARVIAAIDPGESVQMTLYRDGELITLDVNIGQMPGAEQEASVQPQEPAVASLAGLGLTLSSSGSDGVLVSEVETGGLASASGLREGDLILEIGGERISSPAQFEQRLAAVQDNGKNMVLLLVRSGDRQQFVALELDRG